ncbi:MAG: MAPEG family protein [Boseongicola sp.]
METFGEYGHALVAIAIWILVVQVLSAWVGVTKANSGVPPGGTPPEDYANKDYRLHRAYENSVANLSVLVAAIVIAVLAGASPFWVNTLASIAVVARLVMVYVHSQGMGKATQGLRTGIFVFHWALIVLITILAVVAVF